MSVWKGFLIGIFFLSEERGSIKWLMIILATRNSTFFNYDELTWDVVADLPRDTPLVLPLGSGYDLSLLADQLSHPTRIGLLPAFPFGWRGSGLEVPDAIFTQYIVNLLDSLRDDGFSRVYCLAPQGIDPQSAFILNNSASVLRLPHQSLYAPKTFLPPDSERGKVILIPIGHTEQHGFHLPLMVDTVIIDSIAKGTASQVPTRSWSMPVMPYGVSTHRSSFAATMNAGGRAFEDFWVAVIDVLVARGFDRFYLMSGHGGNSSFLVNVVKYAGERHRRIFCATAFLHTSGSIGAAALDKYRTSKIGGMGHACELETSYMLHLRPDLCQMERVVDETDFVSAHLITTWIGSKAAHWLPIRPGMMTQRQAHMAQAVTRLLKRDAYGWKLQFRKKLIMWSKSTSSMSDVRKEEMKDMDCGES